MSAVSEDDKGELKMRKKNIGSDFDEFLKEEGLFEENVEYIPVHCSICNTNFNLKIDEHGCALGVCNCEEISEDLGLEDTVPEDAISIYDDFIVKMPPIKQHTQKVKIKSIKRGTPNIIEFDYIEEKKRSESK